MPQPSTPEDPHPFDVPEHEGTLAEKPSAGRDRSDAAPLDPGGMLGHYRVIRELGRGGQGVVLLAEDVRLHRRVALKVLTGLGPGSESAVQRFRREAEVASKLHHPGICGVHDAGVIGGVAYIAMHYVEGHTLADKLSLLRRDRTRSDEPSFVTFSETPSSSSAEPARSAARTKVESVSRGEILATVGLFVKVAEALHAAHEAGVVHRDIKPGNIMVTGGGDPVILDFGLAHADDAELPSLTRTGDFFGTPAYMSPEQLTGQRIRIDRRTDVYSLGVTLYECLTLERPFDAPTRQALYQAVLTKEAPDPRRRNPAIDTDLKVVLETALEKDWDRRYQSAKDLAEDLGRILRKEPIRARPIGPVGRLLRWMRREPAKAALLGVLLVTLPIIAALVTSYWKDRPEVERARLAALERRKEVLLADASWELSEGSVPLSLRTYEEVLALDPRCPEAAVGKALAYVNLKSPESALRTLDDYASVLGESHAAGLIRADTLRNLGRTTEAEAVIAGLKPPSSVFDHALLALQQLHAGHEKNSKEAFERAIEHATKAQFLSVAPRFDLMVLRAHAAGHARSSRVAKETAPALQRHWPHHAQAHFFAAFALHESADESCFEDSVAAYRETIRLEPTFATAYLNLAVVLTQLGRMDEARTMIAEGSRQGGDPATAKAALGALLAKSGQFDEAIAALQESLRLRPADILTRFNLGFTFVSARRYSDAIAPLREVVQRDPQHAIAFLNLGNCLSEVGDPEGAITAFREALRARPDYVEARVNLGLEYARQGDIAAGTAELREAVRFDPRHGMAQANLGTLLFGVGNIDEAMAAWNAAIRAAPGLPEPHAFMGRALADLDRVEEALVSLRRSLELAVGNPNFSFPVAEVIAELEALQRTRQQLRERIEAHLAAGTEPESPVERARMARVLLLDAKTALALTWYERAFTDEPRLEADLGERHRALAASAGLRAAASVPDPDKAASLRQAALARLEADVDRWRELLERGRVDAGVLGTVIAFYASDPGIALIRPTALSSLPESLRPAALMFWFKVSRLKEELH